MLYILLLTLVLGALLASTVLRVDGPKASVAVLWPDVPSLEIETGEVGSLPPSVVATAGATAGQWDVAVTLASDAEAETCSLAGEFNHWNADSHPMERTSDGQWRIDLTLTSGQYRYKFCLDRTRWIPDPANDEGEEDGFESHNSILRLGALGHSEKIEAEPHDGIIVTSVLEHDPARPLYLHRLGVDRVRVRYRTLVNDVERVDLAVGGRAPVVMRAVRSPDPVQYWEADIDVPAESVEYGFAIVDDGTHAADPRTHTLDPDALPVIRTPEWAKDAIWYQIFPERFRNGDPSNDPDPVRSWTSAWNEPADFEGQDGQTFWEYYVYQRMYGGDLAGIEQKLDHLISLGVTAIYLNPVFHARGPHKYNSTDFRHIDTGFGAGEDYHEATKDEDLLDPTTWGWTPSDRLFLDFLKTCKARGLRVVLDAVFNHVGVMHPAFQDVQEHGEASRFADWFVIRSWQPFQYGGWAGFGELPVFAKSPHGFASDAVRDHIFAVTRRWMDPDGDGDPGDGIDGWRLDVPMELSGEFWADWRVLVKSINPDAYVSGEIWGRADEWLTGRHFDAVMNYRFAEPTIAWIGHRDRKISVTEFDRRLLEVRLAYPEEIGLALMNLVDSHDTDRVASMLLNPDRPYDRSNQVQRHPEYNAGRPLPEHFQRVRLIALLQMTYFGAPMVFYGDEVGMWGADDPTNRQPMVWKDLEPYDNADEVFVDEDHLAFYREVIELRRRYRALRRGSFETILTDDDQDLLVFARELDGSRLLVALNASDRVASFQLPDAGGASVGDADRGEAGPRWQPVFGGGSHGEGGDEAAPLDAPREVPPISGRVWHLAEPS